MLPCAFPKVKKKKKGFEKFSTGGGEGEGGGGRGGKGKENEKEYVQTEVKPPRLESSLILLHLE